MARPSKKTVYERIEEKELEITKTEEQVKILNEELQILFAEKDNLEMHQLLNHMKLNGLTIDKAVELLNANN